MSNDLVPRHLMTPPPERETPPHDLGVQPIKPKGELTVEPYISKLRRDYKQFVECMHCHAPMGTQTCSEQMAGTVSHGICDACWPAACESFGMPRNTPKPQ